MVPLNGARRPPPPLPPRPSNLQNFAPAARGNGARPPPPVLSDYPEVFIGVMGATGSGKSNFINLASGSKMAVDTGLRSCTTQIETADAFEMSGKRVVLVDTPGFDDTMLSDTEILKRVSVYLSSTYQAGFKLSPLRAGNVSPHIRDDHDIFERIVAAELAEHAELASRDACHSAVGHAMYVYDTAARERQLHTEDILAKPALEEGVRMARHDGSLAFAQHIIGKLVDNDPMTLRIEREIIKEKKDIAQTAASVELDRELAALRKQHKQQLAEIQREMEEALANKDLKSNREHKQVKTDLQNRPHRG